jgi:hypothetical protein
MRASRHGDGLVPVRSTDENRAVTEIDDLPREALMSVVLALAAFPVLTVLLMALSRAEESLSNDTDRSPAAR